MSNQTHPQVKTENYAVMTFKVTAENSKNFQAYVLNEIATSAFYLSGYYVLDISEVDKPGYLDDLENIWNALQASSVNIIGMVSGRDRYFLNILNKKAPLALNAMVRSGQSDIAEAKSQTVRIMRNIRSGETVDSDKGDLIIVGNVAPGSEIKAHGNIHVYGSLRGRALVGTGIGKAACLMADSLEPELISIGGYYLTRDDIPKEKLGQPAVVSFDEDAIKITKR